MKNYSSIIALLFVLGMWGCSKIQTAEPDLRKSLEDGVADINLALDRIAQTKAYQVLTVTEDLKKSGEEYIDSISLDLVAGIYDYQPDTLHRRNFYIPYRLFKKTGENNHMIVNLPEKLIFRPWYLHNCSPSDTVLKNNFTIDASDYHYFYTWFFKFDYRLAAALKLNSENIGNLDIQSHANSESGRSYSSKYSFIEGYDIVVDFQSGDTTRSSFALSKGDDILLKESALFIGTDRHKKERQYILTIGDIDIVRSTKIDSIQVYQNGVLQKTAAAVIIDSTENSGSICRHRDIQLTFDDGSTVNLSTLIKPALTTLRTLVGSLHSMCFARNIVDYIAISIYYHSKY